MPYIGKQLVRGQNRELDDISGSFNGATTTFNLTVAGDFVTPGSALQLFISIGGVLQNPNTDFTVAGNQITFSTAPGSGLSFFGYLQGDAVDFNTPADGSVTTAKLGSNLTINVADGSESTPSIQFNGSGTDTGFYSPAADEIAITEGGSEALRIDSSGRLLVGTSSARANFNNSTVYAKLQVEGVSNSESSISVIQNFNGNSIGGRLILGKSNDSVVGSNTIVSDDNTIGTVSFQGNDGSEFVEAAKIEAFADGTPGADDMPGRLVFSVTADGSASPTEAMRINNAGKLLIGYTSDNGAYKLQVNSQIFATSATIATSDGRYKENVATLGECLDLVKALRPVSFTWKPQEDITRTDADGNEVLVREGHNFPAGTQVGFIAQEVQEVLEGKPWLGSVIKENVRPAVKDAEGNELAPEEQFYGIAEGNLIAVLTNALQEAVGRIEALEAEVTALKG